MVKEMHIEFLNGGEILVNCKFKLNKESQFEFEPRDTSELKYNQKLDSTLYCEIPRNSFFSILTC